MFDFKGLIDALMRRAREEDDAGPSVTRLLIDLPRDETLVVLTEIIKALAALNRNAKVGLKERYQAVQAFDDKARPLAQVLVRVFRGEEKIDSISPRQALPSLLACWKELASAYKLCLKQHAQSPNKRFAQDAELITLRSVSYYALQAKWAYLRYFDAEPRLWRSLNRLYQIAEAAGFANKAMQAYPDAEATSVSQIYRHAMLLKLAEPERRRIEEIWQLDRWLQHWQEKVTLEKIIRPRDQSYAINLDETRPPMKLRRNMVGERYRYLDTEPLADYLAELALNAGKGIFPVAIPVPAKADQPAVASLLSDLALIYSRAGQTRSRRSERRHKEHSTSAALGLNRIYQLLRANGAARDWEEWMLADESANGMGAHYKAKFDDKLAVCEVLALKDEDGVWLAVVRRLNKSREGLVKVGAERLGMQPTPVMLEGNGQSLPALYCAESPHGRILLMGRDKHQKGGVYTLSSGSKRYQITLGAAIETLPDYIISSFSVTAKG